MEVLPGAGKIGQVEYGECRVVESREEGNVNDVFNSRVHISR